MTPGILIGISHDKNGLPIIRTPRVLKVGIGVPKGRACYVYTYQGRWIIRYGVWTQDKKLVMETAKGADGKNGFATKEEAQQYYATNKSKFAESNRPQKIPFFTFTKRQVIEVNGKPQESFEPDFAAIEAHGDTPREIDIVFMGENPLYGEYQAWSATELKCHGDGLSALRLIQLGNDKWPGWKEASDKKEKYFPVDECFVSGLCPYAQEGGKDKLVCKPMTTLSFQLANSIRLGATAYFTTTSIKSASQLFSSLEMIKTIAAMAGSGIANTPMKLVLAPFKTNHNGIAATQYGVSLELRTQDVKTLRAMLTESSWKPAPAMRMLAEATEEPLQTATEMVAEFHPEAGADPQFDEGEEVEDPGGAAASAAAATDKKAEDLKGKLAAKREAAAPVVAATPATPAPAPAPTAPSSSTDAEKDAKWRQRLIDQYVAKLGAEKFHAMIQKELGPDSDIDSVTTLNYQPIWKAMEAEVNGGMVAVATPSTAPVKDGNLF